MSNQQAKQIIEAAADLLEEKGWTRGCFARGVGGVTVDIEDTSATCFCSHGAIYRAGYDLVSYSENTRIGFEDYLAANTDCDTIISWNDAPDQTAENVIKTLRKYAATLDEGAIK